MATRDLHQLQGRGNFQGTFINFREEEIFIFRAWVYTIIRLSTPTLFAN
jgi:hypothetical protein